MINLPYRQRIKIGTSGFRAEKKLVTVEYFKKFEDITLCLLRADIIFIGQKAEKLVKAAILLQGVPKKASAGIQYS